MSLSFSKRFLIISKLAGKTDYAVFKLFEYETTTRSSTKTNFVIFLAIYYAKLPSVPFTMDIYSCCIHVIL